jgi:hypothetical protein
MARKTRSTKGQEQPVNTLDVLFGIFQPNNRNVKEQLIAKHNVSFANGQKNIFKVYNVTSKNYPCRPLSPSYVKRSFRRN